MRTAASRPAPPPSTPAAARPDRSLVHLRYRGPPDTRVLAPRAAALVNQGALESGQAAQQFLVDRPVKNAGLASGQRLDRKRRLHPDLDVFRPRLQLAPEDTPGEPRRTPESEP